MNLKLFAVLLSIVSYLGTKANPSIQVGQDDQIPLGYYDVDLDLNSPRLVELEGEDPMWMTEIEKVYYYAVSSNRHN